MLSGNSLKQTVHTHCASVHQAAKLVAAFLRVVGVTAGLVESNGSLQPGLWLTSPAGWLPRTGINSGTLRSVIEYGLPLPFLHKVQRTNHLLHCTTSHDNPLEKWWQNSMSWEATAVNKQLNFHDNQKCWQFQCVQTKTWLAAWRSG